MDNCATPSNNNRNLQASDYNLRILHVVDMASQLGTEAIDGFSRLDDPLESFVDALLEDKRQHPSLEPLAEVFRAVSYPFEDWQDKREYERETLAENASTANAQEFFGFGVQLGSPVRDYHSHTSYSCSWGFYNTVWVYAESLDDAWKLGMAWSEQKRQNALKAAGFPLMCSGCGSTMTSTELEDAKQKDPKLLSCCPERRMEVPHA